MFTFNQKIKRQLQVAITTIALIAIVLPNPASFVQASSASASSTSSSTVSANASVVVENGVVDAKTDAKVETTSKTEAVVKGDGGTVDADADASGAAHSDATGTSDQGTGDQGTITPGAVVTGGTGTTSGTDAAVIPGESKTSGNTTGAAETSGRATGADQASSTSDASSESSSSSHATTTEAVSTASSTSTATSTASATSGKVNVNVSTIVDGSSSSQSKAAFSGDSSSFATATCSAFVSVNADDSIHWKAGITGSPTDFIYTWSGTENLSGTSVSLNKTYASAGIKNAQVVVTATDSSITSVTCTIATTVTPSVTPPAGTTKGSIKICKIITDSEGKVVTSDLPKGIFTITLGTSTDLSDTSVQDISINASTFTANSQILPTSTENDADCTTVSNLPIASYFYGEESISGDIKDNWSVVGYNDQNSTPVKSVSDVFPYSGQLFNGNPSDDSARNLDTDGNIILSANTPNRTLVIVNTFKAEPVIPPTPDFCIVSDSPWASSIVSHRLGLDNHGNAILLGRDDPTQALGASNYDSVSLGFGGEIVVTFDKPFKNETGADIQIFESSGTADFKEWPEQAKVYASKDNVNYTYLGIVQVGGGKLDLGDLDWAQYIKIVDITDKDADGFKGKTSVVGYDNLMDGFDVDAVKALTCGDEGSVKNPATVDLTTDKTTITVGSPVTLTWTTGNNPNSCTATEGWSGDKTSTGGSEVIPGLAVGSHTFTINCENTDGSGTDTVIVTVEKDTTGGGTTPQCSDGIDNDGDTLIDTKDPGCHTDNDPTKQTTYDPSKDSEADALPTVDLKINGNDSTTVNNGDTATLTWTSEYATSCTATEGWTGTQILSGTQDVTVTANTSYTITCENAEGKTVVDTVVANIKTNNGGGGSHNNGGGGGHSTPGQRAPQQGEVLGATTGPVAACSYLKDFLRIDWNNDPVEVTKLQAFLKYFEGFDNLEITGHFNQATFDAVEIFQQRYASDVLNPWGYADNQPTGFVYITTRNKINEIFCNQTYALTGSQMDEISLYHNFFTSLRNAGVPAADYATGNLSSPDTSVGNNGSATENTPVDLIPYENEPGETGATVGVTTPGDNMVATTESGEVAGASSQSQFAQVAAAALAFPTDASGWGECIFFFLIALAIIYLVSTIIVNMQDLEGIKQKTVRIRKMIYFIGGLVVAIIIALLVNIPCIVIPLLVVLIALAVGLIIYVNSSDEDATVIIPTVVKFTKDTKNTPKK